MCRTMDPKKLTEAAVELACRTNISEQMAMQLLKNATSSADDDAHRLVVDVIANAESGELSTTAAMALLEWLGVKPSLRHQMLEVAVARYGLSETRERASIFDRLREVIGDR